MLCSALWAVLAVALSSSVDAAQSQNYLAFDLSYDLPEPVQPALPADYLTLARGLDFTEPAQQASTIAKPDFSITTIKTMIANLDPQKRLLWSLYAAHGTLQVLDLVTTSKALGAGNREGNPVFKSGNITAMAMAKTAVVGLHVYAAERLNKTRPKAAKWMMIASNVVMSAVVMNNVAVLIN